MTMLQHGVVPSSGGYNIERSLRFNSADSAYLNQTPANTGNRRTFTWSCWFKRADLGSATSPLFTAGASTTDAFDIFFNGNDKLQVQRVTGTTYYFNRSTQVFRDPSAWYHIVVAVDTTNATSGDRVRVYINGSEITVWDNDVAPPQNHDYPVNTASYPGRIGRSTGDSSSYYMGGYMADVHFIDGSALTPSSFGENDTDTGVWKPKAYTGSYGTNGFKLTFSDNSGTTSTTLGKDTSGNGNNWTPNNFSVTAGAGNDSLVDTPTPYGSDTGAGGEVRGNYATLNPLVKTDSGSANTLSDGNLRANCTSGSYGDSSFATIPVSSGKWYAEFTLSSASYPSVEIFNMNFPPNFGFSGNGRASLSPYGYGYLYTGNKQNNASASSYGSTFTTGDVIGIALDMDNGKVFFSKNGTWQASGDPAAGTNAAFTGLSGNFAMCICDSQSGSFSYANFGQRPFAYTAPSGFKALCTTNLPTPAIGATSTTRADDYFNTVLYTGNGSTQSITGVGFQPDFVWLKSRRDVYGHQLFDAVRGATKRLSSNVNDAEVTNANSLTAFNSDGFSVGTDAGINTSTNTMVSWNWKANGAGSSNTAGSITSTVSANTTAGFSICTYTGNGLSNATFGHGLGVTPSMIIVKRRTGATNHWAIYHSALGANKYIYLNLTQGTDTVTGLWGSSGPSSSLVYLPTGTAQAEVNASGGTYVAYCFAEVAGYSRFGSYVGNGSADGPFVYTGFRPKFLMVKLSSTGTESWQIVDTSRDPYNVSSNALFPNLSNAETSASSVNRDILSNGFKIRSSDTNQNGNGSTYIYAAFAEVPQKFSLAR